MDRALILQLHRPIQGLFFRIALLIAATGPFAQAQEESPAPILPDIEVRSLELTVEKLSTNKRVILFTQQDDPPALRQLIMIKDSGGPKIALRVIKLFDASDLKPGSSRFAAQWVRTYNESFDPKLRSVYRAILKLRDIEPPPEPTPEPTPGPVPSPEPEPLPPAEETPPPEEKSAQQITEAEELELKSLAYEEPRNLEPEKDAVAFVVGAYRFASYTDGSLMFLNCAGVRYSKTWMSPAWYPWREGSWFQDSLSFDLAATIGKRLEYAEAGDSYTVMPFAASLRYNLNLSESFSLFLNLGVMKPFVLSSVTSGTDGGLAAQILGQPSPVFGGGLMWEVGPQWFVRMDLGIDSINGGIVLKY